MSNLCQYEDQNRWFIIVCNVPGAFSEVVLVAFVYLMQASRRSRSEPSFEGRKLIECSGFFSKCGFAFS